MPIPLMIQNATKLASARNTKGDPHISHKQREPNIQHMGPIQHVMHGVGEGIEPTTFLQQNVNVETSLNMDEDTIAPQADMEVVPSSIPQETHSSGQQS